MKITILTTGSRGDTQPYVALGKGLQAAGHTVRLAASEAFADFVADHGLDFYPLRGNISELAKSNEAVAAMKADTPIKFFQSFRRVLKNEALRSLMDEMQQGFFEASQGADALVYHPGAAIGYFIAGQMQIPGILASPFPMTPTRAYPALIFYNKLRLGGMVNELTHHLFEWGFWLANRTPAKKYWKQNFGGLPSGFSNPYRAQRQSGQPIIISCSKYIFPNPKTHNKSSCHTGYWFLDSNDAWQPPAALEAFLTQGAPPVYLGFGSVGDPAQQAQTTEIVVQALRQAGRRGVLATGWQGLSDRAALGADMFMLQHAPHSWLFPRMTAVVHHGGAGTTAAGLRAGVPAVVVPHGNDQFAWGQRLQELGVGAASIPRRKLTAVNLAEGITAALQDDVRAAAAALGEKIRGEDGVGTAVEIILNHVGR